MFKNFAFYICIESGASLAFILLFIYHVDHQGHTILITSTVIKCCKTIKHEKVQVVAYFFIAMIFGDSGRLVPRSVTISEAGITEQKTQQLTVHGRKR